MIIILLARPLEEIREEHLAYVTVTTTHGRITSTAVFMPNLEPALEVVSVRTRTPTVTRCSSTTVTSAPVLPARRRKRVRCAKWAMNSAAVTASGMKCWESVPVAMATRATTASTAVTRLK